MKIVFMGTPEFSVETLKEIVQNGHEVVGVVTQPDKPKGRGMNLTPSPVKVFATQHNMLVLQPQRLRKAEDCINMLKDLKPDLIVVVAFGQILTKSVLDIPKHGCINVHVSLLPKYRGSAPMQWAIINGEKTVGVTTMYMDEGIDTGDMLLKKEISLTDEDDLGTVHDKMKVIGAKLLIETIQQLEKGILVRHKQTGEFSLAPMIKKENEKIEWSKSAIEIFNLVRGLNPFPVAFTTLEEKIFKIGKIKIIDKDTIGNPGQILNADCNMGIDVQTGKGIIRILELQEQNCKRMNCCDYLRGKKVEKDLYFI